MQDEDNNMPDFDITEENNPLHVLLQGKCCSTDDIKHILRMGVSINSVNSFDATPLHVSVCNDNCSPEVIKYLLDNGANVNAVDDTGTTPLHYLVQFRNKHAVDMAVLLLDYGADIHASDNGDNTVLHIATAISSNKELIKLLLDRGSDINASDSTRYSPLHSALYYKCTSGIVELLLQQGADVHQCNWVQRQPLYSAINSCNTHVVQLVLNYGARVNVLDCYNESPLYLSASYNKIEVAKMLLDGGALVSCGKSPLQKVISKYNSRKDKVTLETVELLLKYALLENAALDIEDFPAELTDYREGCLREIRAMQRVSVDDTTLLQFIFRLFQELKHKSKDEIHCISDKLLHLIFTNAYPLYNDVIFGLLKREYLVDKLLNQMVYTVSNQPDPFSGIQNSAVLHRHVQPTLIKSLFKVDLLNLVMAYYNSHGCFSS